MGQGLQEHDFGHVPRCSLCGGPAAGPCASCRKLVCGTCSVLTEGGTRSYAICLKCAKRGGVSLRPAWLGLFAWLLGLLLMLGVAVALLAAFAHSR